MSTLRTHARNETKKGSTYPEYSAYHYIRLKAIKRVANSRFSSFLIFLKFPKESNKQRSKVRLYRINIL